MLKFFGIGGNGAKVMDSNPILQNLRGYWDSKRIGGALPCRSSIDPRGMSDYLENVFLIERIAKGNARFRLAGTHLQDLLGMDLRGMPITALFAPGARERIAGELEALFDTPTIVETVLEAERGLGRPAVAGRMLLLPLTNRHQEVELALGCLVTEGQIGHAPRRFAISGVLRQDEVQAPVVPGLTLVAVNAATARMPRPLPKPAPKLRLVTSND